MVELDPTDHEIADLGPKVNQIDDAEELREMLALESKKTTRRPIPKASI